jgi:signal transduction histidine kinase
MSDRPSAPQPVADALRQQAFVILSRLQSGTEDVVRLNSALAALDAAVAAARAEERAEVLRELREWEAEYMHQARGGDNSGRSDARADAAREIHDHLSSSWGTRERVAAIRAATPQEPT